MKKIVFVCTGNTCRSVMAEYLARKMLSRAGLESANFEVLSRGTAASDAYRVPEIVKTLLAAEGLSVEEHKSSPVEAADIEDAEAVFVMEPHHKLLIEAMFGCPEKIRLLGADGAEIPDPVGQADDVYRATFETIKSRLSEIMPDMARKTPYKGKKK